MAAFCAGDKPIRGFSIKASDSSSCFPSFRDKIKSRRTSEIFDSFSSISFKFTPNNDVD